MASLVALLAVADAASGYTPPPLLHTDVNPQSALTCRSCHVDITTQWSASAHAGADQRKNLLFGQMYFTSLRATRGATMVKCAPCHETIPFVSNDFEKLRDVSAEGVTCVYCHTVSGPGPEDAIPPFTLDLRYYHGTIRLPVQVKDHGSAYSDFITKSDYCGGCHRYSNQNGVPISDTFGEWKRSKYAKQGITCQKCHMPGGPGRNSSMGPARPRVADHSFAGPDRNRELQGAATLTLRSGARSPDTLRVVAQVSNVGAGHSIPTGNDQHVVLIRIRVTDVDGRIVWENDPFQDWDHSVFGLLLANELGAYPADTWTAVKILSDTRVAAGASSQTRFIVPVGDAKGPFRVAAQLLHRRARPETIDAYGLPEDPYGIERLMAEAAIEIP